VALQGFIDDSGEGDAPGDPVFVLGGLISSAKKWEAFSREWRGALDDPPSIQYFKMAEAANFSAKGQFARRLGWTEAKRDVKLELLTGVIVRHVELKVNCSVDKVAFAKYARSLAVPQRTSIINKPYAIAFQHIILATASVFLTYEIDQPCDFTFDEQGKIGQNAVAMWDVLKQLVEVNAARGRPDFGPHLCERPVFGNDRLFLPLQAADFYAWHVRRSLSPNKVLHSAPGKVMRDLEGVSTISRHVDEERLVSFRNRIETGARVFAAKNPNVELLGYQGTIAQQRAARVAARAGMKHKSNRS
jgi:hypothetical protein